jgi:hypothetical protein
VCWGVVKRLLVPTIDGLGSPSVTWVLDELGVVGDDIFDWVTPEKWSAVGSLFWGRRVGMPPTGSASAGAFDRETVMCC